MAGTAIWLICSLLSVFTKGTGMSACDLSMMPIVSVCPGQTPERFLGYQYFSPGDKARSKSRASFHALEFLSRVFAREGASRFFVTFLLRFLFDTGGKQSSEDSSSRRG